MSSQGMDALDKRAGRTSTRGRSVPPPARTSESATTSQDVHPEASAAAVRTSNILEWRSKRELAAEAAAAAQAAEVSRGQMTNLWPVKRLESAKAKADKAKPASVAGDTTEAGRVILRSASGHGTPASSTQGHTFGWPPPAAADGAAIRLASREAASSAAGDEELPPHGEFTFGKTGARGQGGDGEISSVGEWDLEPPKTPPRKPPSAERQEELRVSPETLELRRTVEKQTAQVQALMSQLEEQKEKAAAAAAAEVEPVPERSWVGW